MWINIEIAHKSVTTINHVFMIVKKYIIQQNFRNPTICIYNDKKNIYKNNYY